ncbi:MAG: aldolase/citrate lyase family protein [Pseudomonadota bacterium]
MLTERIRAREPLVGTFLKTPHPMIVEVLGGSGLDYVILDAEHAPFDIAALDASILAGRAVGIPCLVRLTVGTPADILRILDMGADGFLVPHVTSAQYAREIVKAARYGAGGRGYSATNRAGQYGRVPMATHIENATKTAVILQIEDPEGVDAVDEIAAVEGIASCFVGRADLAVAYGVNDLSAKIVDDAVKKVVAACADRPVAVSTFAPSMDQVAGFLAKGVSMVAVASEHKPIQDFFSQAAISAAKGAS